MYDDEAPAAGIITGIGRVQGRECLIIANDATVKGGTYFPMTVKKHLRAQEIALQNHLPCIYLVDSGGAFLPLQAEVFPDREHFGRIFYNQAVMSAREIPQISAVMGSCTAGGAYVPAMSDEAVIVKGTGTIFLGGPPLVKAATGEEVTAEELGGADVHTRISGVADHFAEDDDARASRSCATSSRTCALDKHEPETRIEPEEPLYDPKELYGVIPRDLRKPYDVREVIARIVDGSRFHEFKERYAHDARHRLRADLRLQGRHPREQRRALLGVGAQGDALHRAVQPAPHPARLPAEHHRLHGRQAVRARRHRQGRREDGARRRQRHRAEVHGDHRRLVRRRKLRHVRPRLLAALPLDVAERAHLRDGRRAGRGRADDRQARSARARREGAVAPRKSAAIADPVLAKYETEGSPYYSTARLWDDGVIDPAETRTYLGLGLSIAYNAPIESRGSACSGCEPVTAIA